MNHFIIGLDLHDTWPIGSPAPSPAPTVHPVVVPIQGVMTTWTVKLTKTVFSENMPMIQHGSDTGLFTPHINPINALLPLVLISASSKTQVGCFTVQVDKKPVGCAIPFVVAGCFNNLDCMGPASPPLPLPLADVFAFTTVFTGFSLADLAASVVGMVIDMAVMAGIQKFFGPAGPGGRFGDMLGNRLASALGPQVTRFITVPLVSRGITNRMAQNFLAANMRNLPGTALGWMIGSPLGHTWESNPLFGEEGVYGEGTGWAQGNVHDLITGVDNY